MTALQVTGHGFESFWAVWETEDSSPPRPGFAAGPGGLQGPLEMGFVFADPAGYGLVVAATRKIEGDLSLPLPRSGFPSLWKCYGRQFVKFLISVEEARKVIG